MMSIYLNTAKNDNVWGHSIIKLFCITPTYFAKVKLHIAPKLYARSTNPSTPPIYKYIRLACSLNRVVLDLFAYWHFKLDDIWITVLNISCLRTRDVCGFHGSATKDTNLNWVESTDLSVHMPCQLSVYKRMSNKMFLIVHNLFIALSQSWIIPRMWPTSFLLLCGCMYGCINQVFSLWYAQICAHDILISHSDAAVWTDLRWPM